VAPDDDAADMYLEAMAALDQAGYHQYEISNVSRPGRESCHNLVYWRDGEWLAFGSGAHGAGPTTRWRNVAGTGEYIARIHAGRTAVAETTPRDPATRAEEALFMGLRLADGIDLARMSARYGVDVWARYGARLAPFERAGHLQHEPGRRIRLTRHGMLVANEAMAIFLDQENRVE
jgi:oxygen-independent coproporphyrinogen-3 oxidase